MRSIARLTLYLSPLALFAGCAAQSSSMPATPSAAAAPQIPTQIAFSDEALPNTDATVGIHLVGETPTKSPRYGQVLGYIKGTTSKVSQVVVLGANQPVVFKNVDVITHTASFLGDASSKSAPWPSKFTGQEAASKAGTAIGTTHFSSGPLNSMKTSLAYTTGAPGFYMFGCFFHYVGDGMRTVIIVE